MSERSDQRPWLERVASFLLFDNLIMLYEFLDDLQGGGDSLEVDNGRLAEWLSLGFTRRRLVFDSPIAYFYGKTQKPKYKEFASGCQPRSSSGKDPERSVRRHGFESHT